MFSFHKPKVYRSRTGCCICRAKSSSSRFTDSKKYEGDFVGCFQLQEQRTGEICNACVLLVKRWKKLPAGITRNWPHVVDGRAGPGIKSLTKFKSKNKKKPKKTSNKIEKIIKKKHVYLKPERDREQSPAISDDLNEEYLANTGSKGSSRSGTPQECDDIVVDPEKRLTVSECTDDKELSVNDFIDMTYFKRVKICCGVIFKGPYGEVIVDPSLIKRSANCINRQRCHRQQESNNLSNSPFHSSASASPVHSLASSSPAHSLDSTTESSTTTPQITKPASKTFSDSSSDSGYDESSNQGIGESKIVKSSIINISNTASANITTVKLNQVETIQLNSTTLVSETVRLSSELPIKLIPIKHVDTFTCKPLTTLVGTASIRGANTHSIAVQNNPLVDFAIHASTRQSVIN